MTERRRCKCHDVPMVLNGVKRRKKGPVQDWRCRVKQNERNHANYDGLSGVAYSWHLLRTRRNKALMRRRRRET